MLTVAYNGSEEWELTFDPKKKVILTTREIEELTKRAPEFLYSEKFAFNEEEHLFKDKK